MAFGRFPSAGIVIRRAREMTGRRAVVDAIADAGYPPAVGELVVYVLERDSAAGVRRAGGFSQALTPANALAVAARLQADPELALRAVRAREAQAEEREERAGIVGAVTGMAAAGLVGAVTAGAASREQRIAAALPGASFAELGFGDLAALGRAPSGPTSPPGGAPVVLGQPAPMRLSGSGGTMASVGAPTAAPRVDPSLWRRLLESLRNRGTTTRQPTALRAWRPAAAYSYRRPTALVGRGIYSGYNPMAWR